MKAYIDMDGVLANLFDYVGNTVHGKSHKHLSPEEKADLKSFWLDKERFNKTFPSIRELFANLEPFPTNDALIQTVINKFGGFHICSHPSRMDLQECIKGKKDWLMKHIMPKYGKYLLGAYFPTNKADYAMGEDSPNLLIDDFPTYIQRWESAGGVAIKLQSTEFSSGTQMKQFLESEFQKLK